MLKSHLSEEDAEVYEFMSATTQDIMMKYSSCSEDVYESMLEISPECADDLCNSNLILFVCSINFRVLKEHI